jgi:UDP-glucose 4-epimerase
LSVSSSAAEVKGIMKVLVTGSARSAFADIISATTPFVPGDLPGHRLDAPRVVWRRVPEYEAEYERRGWRMFPSIGRVYVNDRARGELGWQPRCCLADNLGRLRAGDDLRGPLARIIGSKGYHAEAFWGGPYPVG